MPVRLLVTTTLLLLLSLGAAAQDLQTRQRRAEKQAAIRAMGQETIEWLQSERPEVAEQLEASAGFAVFDNLGVNPRLLRHAYGHGLARDAKSGEIKYMKTRLLGSGMGMGVSGSRVLLIFRGEEPFETFAREGMQVGLEGGIGPARSSQPGDDEGFGIAAKDLIVYQITSAGLVAKASINGTRYWMDDWLN